ncbi:DUF397 domain-containing protein [Actinomadura rupiterrae]|uniref:DUF397 domain-containing protein n=1 Tax=Actinomadura rupiterrae TaxID=559627 RepID=UPI0026465AB7|nr:DUF397 domain-containing protein [Actinomadura rupiterrae]
MYLNAEICWRRSSWSGEGMNCVELAALPPGDGFAVRDSKDPDGSRLPLEASGLAALLAGVKASVR